MAFLLPLGPNERTKGLEEEIRGRWNCLCETGSPRPSPRRWLRSKVASAALQKRMAILVAANFLFARHIALTIALISFRKNPSFGGATITPSLAKTLMMHMVFRIPGVSSQGAETNCRHTSVALSIRLLNPSTIFDWTKQNGKATKKKDYRPNPSHPFRPIVVVIARVITIIMAANHERHFLGIWRFPRGHMIAMQGCDEASTQASAAARVVNHYPTALNQHLWHWLIPNSRIVRYLGSLPKGVFWRMPNIWPYWPSWIPSWNPSATRVI